MEVGRGGACVPARVAPQGRIYRSIPAHDTCILGMETPLRERSGGHTGTAPRFRLDRLRVGSWFRLGRLRVEWVISFGGLRVGGCLFVGKTVHMNQHHRCCTFDSPGLIERSEIYPG